MRDLKSIEADLARLAFQRGPGVGTVAAQIIAEPAYRLAGDVAPLLAEVAALRTENDIAKSRIAQFADHARHLMLIVRELRELGIDPPLVKLSEDGVTDAGMTLTDELSLIAINVDWDGAMSIRLDGNGVTDE